MFTVPHFNSCSVISKRAAATIATAMRQSSLDTFFVASKCVAPNDAVDMESLDALREYLNAESIEHNSTMDLCCSSASLFGMSAIAFNAMAPAARDEAAKAHIVRVPVFGRMICAYDRADDYFNTTVYECTLLTDTE